MIITVLNNREYSSSHQPSTKIAREMTNQGKRVLLIDLNPKSFLSTYMGVSGSVPGMVKVLRGKLLMQEAIVPTSEGDIIPSDTNPHHLKSLFYSDENLPHFEWVVTMLDQLYDNVIIECPTDMTFMTLNAVHISSSVLINAADLADLEDSEDFTPNILDICTRLTDMKPISVDNTKEVLESIEHGSSIGSRVIVIETNMELEYISTGSNDRLTSDSVNSHLIEEYIKHLN